MTNRMDRVIDWMEKKMNSRGAILHEVSNSEPPLILVLFGVGRA
jgi:hypothetical protein